MDIEHIKKAAAMMREAMAILSSGPLDYYLTEMAAAHELLMSRYAPFKVGDRVELAVTPTINCKTSYGWLGSKHFLKKGAKGTVIDASCGTRGFCFGVMFDDESWISPIDKTVNLTEPDKRHIFYFDERSLSHAADEHGASC